MAGPADVVGAELGEDGVGFVVLAFCAAPVPGDVVYPRMTGFLETLEVVLTDTIPLPPAKRIPKITTISIAPLIGEAIRSVTHLVLALGSR